MAGFESLLRSIYHERQQPGSMLCAQHALNNLLQGNYFTAPDLSEIGRNLDNLEHHYNNSQRGSANMDDTGFFSVQVLENALSVWGLNLSRWCGEEMKPYQDNPQTQLAFILNLEQHWCTLRRFGHADPIIDNDFGDGHWFNLNSCLPKPQRVGKLYLKLFLQQAESEGYSVFVVRQAEPSASLALPRTVADEIASTLPEQNTSGLSEIDYTQGPIFSPNDANQNFEHEDEDYELQAALQASLVRNGPSNEHEASAPPLAEASPPGGSGLYDPSNSNVGFSSSYLQARGEGGRSDPVASSTSRNQRILERMKAEQHGIWREGITSGAADSGRAELHSSRDGLTEPLRPAVLDSAEEAQHEGHGPEHAIIEHGSDRVYDDDDEELQAALKASLEQMPSGWEFPQMPSKSAPHSQSTILQRLSSPDPQTMTQVDAYDTNFVTTEGQLAEENTETVTVDELRRRRLARFGSGSR